MYGHYYLFIKGSKDVARSSVPWGVSQGPYLLPRGGMLAQNQEEREERSALGSLCQGGRRQEEGQPYLVLGGVRDDRRIEKHL